MNFLSENEEKPFSSFSSLSAPPSHENEKVNVFLPPSAFLINPKWVSNPTVEKDPIQWMRFSESKNPFYLILINKITHPLKFIKKWLYVYKVSLSDI